MISLSQTNAMRINIQTTRVAIHPYNVDYVNILSPSDPASRYSYHMSCCGASSQWRGNETMRENIPDWVAWHPCDVNNVKDVMITPRMPHYSHCKVRRGSYTSTNNYTESQYLYLSLHHSSHLSDFLIDVARTWNCWRLHIWTSREFPALVIDRLLSIFYKGHLVNKS